MIVQCGLEEKKNQKQTFLPKRKLFYFSSGKFRLLQTQNELHDTSRCYQSGFDLTCNSATDVAILINVNNLRFRLKRENEN